MATESEVQDAAGNVQRHGFSTLDVCKHAARCVACSLDDTCRLGLVVYDAQARVVVGLARVTPAHVAKVHAALEKLAPGTSTNLWGGLELGVDELVGGAGDNARAVLLLTDGVPNNSPPEGEVAALRAKRLTKDGSETVAVFAAGFGYALKSDLLLSLAREGGGLFSFVPDAGMVGTSFNHLVASLRSSAATAAAVVADGAVVADLGPLRRGETRRAVLPAGARVVEVVGTRGGRRSTLAALRDVAAAAASPAAGRAARVERFRASMAEVLGAPDRGTCAAAAAATAAAARARLAAAHGLGEALAAADGAGAAAADRAKDGSDALREMRRVAAWTAAWADAVASRPSKAASRAALPDLVGPDAAGEIAAYGLLDGPD
ncbi:hypothetical protein AURANDRAFT_69450, partial [Aureococcus anophagefferens]